MNKSIIRKSIHTLMSLILAVATVFSAGLSCTREAFADTGWAPDTDIYSQSAVLMNYETGTILYEQNPDDELYPASITKILTALVAIENSTMDEVVTFSADSVYKTEGSSIARDVGEEMTMEECLYGMMLESANECAYAIGEHVGGTIEAFVDMMNAKAKELGCTHTHFNNANGLPDEQHYTSARDMALIARAAYANQAFRTICGTGYYEIPPTNKHADSTNLHNHHNMLYPYSSYDYIYDGCKGGKTGYTTVANSTLVTYAERNGMTLICVVMNAQTPQHYLDTKNLLDWGFTSFNLWNISENETDYDLQLESFFDSNSRIFSTDTSLITLDDTASVVLPSYEDFSAVSSELVTDGNGKMSLKYTYNGTIVGEANFAVADISQISFDMPADMAKASSVSEPDNEDVLEIPVEYIFIGAIAAAGVLALIIVIIYFSKNFYIIRHHIETRRQRGSMSAYSRREERLRRRELKREMKRRSKW